MDKTYLGDGVYIQKGVVVDSYVLTTENGIEITNTIVLESDVISVLVDFFVHKGWRFKD